MCIYMYYIQIFIRIHTYIFEFYSEKIKTLVDNCKKKKTSRIYKDTLHKGGVKRD